MSEGLSKGLSKRLSKGFSKVLSKGLSEREFVKKIVRQRISPTKRVACLCKFQFLWLNLYVKRAKSDEIYN